MTEKVEVSATSASWQRNGNSQQNAAPAAAGEGTKVFPPTHASGVYATEQRRLPVEGMPGETHVMDCVLLDTV